MTFIDPNPDVAFFALRLALGIVFLAHGPAKLMKPTSWQIITLGTVETLGAISMILGIWLQPAAAALGIIMLGVIYFKTNKWNKDFTGDNGWEFEFTLLAAALTILIGAPHGYTLF